MRNRCHSENRSIVQALAGCIQHNLKTKPGIQYSHHLTWSQLDGGSRELSELRENNEECQVLLGLLLSAEENQA